MTTSITRRDSAALGGSGSILMRQRRDHARLDTLMNRWLAGGADQELDVLWQDIVQLVFSHAFAEETVLWPVLRRVAPNGEELTGRAERRTGTGREAAIRSHSAFRRTAEWVMSHSPQCRVRRTLPQTYAASPSRPPSASYTPTSSETVMARRYRLAPRVGVEPTSLVLIQSQAGPAGRPTGDWLMRTKTSVAVWTSPSCHLSSPCSRSP